MDAQISRRAIWPFIRRGLLLGGAFGVVDGALLAAFSRLGFAEAFLTTVSPPGLSPAGCRLLLISTIGATLGLINAAAGGVADRRLPAKRKSPASFLAATEIALALVALRVVTRESSVGFFPYVLGLAAAVLFVGAAAWASRKLISRRPAKTAAPSRLPAWIGASFMAFVIGLPFIAEAVLRNGFRAGSPGTGRPNVLFIVLDTVRADSLSTYNPKVRTTPHIDRLAAEGRVYLKAITPAPWTLPAHASMMTGLYPSQHGAIWDNRFLDDGFLTLAECLSETGYQTVGFVENPFVSAGSGLAQGFRDYREMYAYPRLAVLPRLIQRVRQRLFGFKETREYTRETIGHLESWLLRHAGRGSKKPFFAFLNFMAAHLPNYPRPGLTEGEPTAAELRKIEPVNQVPERYYLPRYHLDAEDLAWMRRLYLGDVAYLDARLGELFAFLREKGILDDTIVIVTSDHGENFGDHGLIEHQFCLYNSLLHVPLIVRFPKLVKPGVRSEELVSTIFLFRTILDWVGAPDRPELARAEAQSLARPSEHPRVYAEHENFIGMITNMLRPEAPPGFDFGPFDKSMECIFDSGLKLIWSSTGGREVYSLDADWDEASGGRPDEETAADLTAKLDAWQKGLWRMRPEERARKIDRSAEDALRSLGYIR